MSFLYNRENAIASLVKIKLQNYRVSKEQVKKENELFHLLCFLDKTNKLSLYDNIAYSTYGSLK